jgi:hypothetical protein
MAALIAAVCFLTFSGPAIAQEKPAAKPGAAAEEKADAAKVKVERGKGGKKVYRITEEIRIEGKIQKPEAFYVLQKSSINYDWQDLKQDFLPKILDSVTRAPF